MAGRLRHSGAPGPDVSPPVINAGSFGPPPIDNPDEVNPPDTGGASSSGLERPPAAEPPEQVVSEGDPSVRNDLFL